MSAINIEKTEAEIERIEEKVRELNRRKRILRRKIEDAENEEILEVIRELDLSPEELSDFLKEFTGKDKREPERQETKEPVKVQNTGKEHHHEK